MYEKFIEACESGNLVEVQNLYSETPENDRPKMLAANSYTAFFVAAKNGSLEVVKFLWSICPEDDLSLIHI